jgi:adrenodoxin-NADP+ reductase
VAFHPVDVSLIPENITKLPRAPRRIMEVLIKGSSLSTSSAPKSWSLDFCLSPTAFNPSATSLSQLTSTSFEWTKLVPDPFDLQAKAQGTGDLIDIPSPLAFRSIGYKSEALQGFSELGIPFNNRLGIIPNDRLGRVIADVEPKESAGVAEHVPGMYCAGWVKKGPTGVIAGTMQDAFSTADAIADDWYSHKLFLNGINGGSGLGWDGIQQEAMSRGCRRLSWHDWRKIDAVEKKNGQLKGKEREKFTRTQEMLAVLD